MRKSALALLFALLTSCSTGRLPWDRGISMADARDSVYRVEVDITLDTTQLHKDKSAGGSKTQRVVGLKWTDREKQTGAEVIRQDENTAVVGWFGTGWVGARSGGRSYVMTAGHVCESGRSTYHVEFLDWETLTFIEADLPIVSVVHKLVFRDGVVADAVVIRDEDIDESTYNGTDLCMLGVMADLGAPIPVADDEPEYGQTCQIIGAPRGNWGGGIAPSSDLKFNGRGSIFGVDPDGLSFTGIVAPGNSGSAIMCGGFVVGVDSLGSSVFPGLIHTVPYDSIRPFMRRALHRVN